MFVLTVSLTNIEALLLSLMQQHILVQEAMKSEHWTRAMRQEMNELERSST